MAILYLITPIAAPPAVCFDLCLDIQFHERAGHGRAVAGVTRGRIGLGQTVTWEGVHFLVRQRLTSRIVRLERPRIFVDHMLQGAFAHWRHTHLFVEQPGGHTLMIDHVDFAAPLGPLGHAVDRILLRRYMTRFLALGNALLKREAEAG